MSRTRPAPWLCCLATLVAFTVLCDSATAAAASSSSRRSRPGPRAPAPPCATAVQWQIRLDQHGFSPGQIDGTVGVSTRRALKAFQEAHGNAPSGQPDCAVWDVLDAGDEKPTLMPYEITADDMKGPFIERVPASMEAAAKLPRLQYASPI